MQMFSPGQLRQIHEERIAPYIKGNTVEKVRKERIQNLYNLFKQVK